MEHLGRSQATGFEAYALAIPSPNALLDSFPFLCKNFTCFLAWNAVEMSPASTRSMMEKLLRLGCAYLCCWGHDCERRHDTMDDVIVGDGTSLWQDYDTMTTWHAEESLEDALDYFLDLASPTDCTWSRFAGPWSSGATPSWCWAGYGNGSK